MRFFSTIGLFLFVSLLAGCPIHGDSGKAADTGETGFSCTTDADGDGFVDALCGGDDCNDENADVYPGAKEVCDGVNNNCNGGSENDFSSWLCQDYDRDGFGDPEVCSLECEAQEGYVFNSTDCNDTNADINPSASELCDNIDNDCDGSVDEDAVGGETWYEDNDGDGYGSNEVTSNACLQPDGYVLDGGDCDEYDQAVNPGKSDVCDGKDNDCDGVTDDPEDCEVTEDADGDGYTYVEGDCDDGDATVNPGAIEVCDGIDNDCDGSTDDSDAADATTWYTDVDADGYGDSADGVVACEAPKGYANNNTDCDDGDSSVSPAAVEVCDSVDNDCDGSVNEGVGGATLWYADADGDGYGDSTESVVACEAPKGYANNNTDCNDGNSAVNPAATEICDGIDNDCDGSTDGSDAIDATLWYADADGDGYGDSTESVVACEASTGYVSSNTDCNDGDSAVNPAATEICDEIDNDCDGSVDVADSDVVDVGPYYEDSDGDGFGYDATGLLSCVPPDGFVIKKNDCNDTDASIHPGADEECNGTDSTDYNCDGSVGTDDNDGDGVQACEDCNDADRTIYPLAPEVCDEIDNDCDESVDNDATDAAAWYVDADSDGYGDPSIMTWSCSDIAGYADNGDDCNDAADNAYLGAAEVCDAIDNNCDGGTDEDGVCDTGGDTGVEDTADTGTVDTGGGDDTSVVDTSGGDTGIVVDTGEDTGPSGPVTVFEADFGTYPDDCNLGGMSRSDGASAASAIYLDSVYKACKVFVFASPLALTRSASTYTDGTTYTVTVELENVASLDVTISVAFGGWAGESLTLAPGEFGTLSAEGQSSGGSATIEVQADGTDNYAALLTSLVVTSP